jgi:hypothetical protein
MIDGIDENIDETILVSATFPCESNVIAVAGFEKLRFVHTTPEYGKPEMFCVIKVTKSFIAMFDSVCGSTIKLLV